MDYERLVQLLGQTVSLLAVVLHQLDVHLVLQLRRDPDADARAAQNHEALNLDALLARQLRNALGRLLARDDIDRIALEKLVLPAGDDGLHAARDGHGAELRDRPVGRQIDQIAPQQRRGRLQTEHHQREASAREIDIVGRGGVTQQIYHLQRSHLLGVEQVVDAHADEHLLVVGLQIFVVVDAGDGLLGPQLLGHDGRQNVLVLVVIDGDEQIAPTHARLAQHGESRGVALDRNQVGEAAQLVQRLGVAVDHRDVVTVSAQHARQMAAHLSYARNYYLHPFTSFDRIGPRPEADRRGSSPIANTEPSMRCAKKALFLQNMQQIYKFVVVNSTKTRFY